MENRLTAKRGKVGSKKEKGLMDGQKYGDCWEKGGIKGLNSNGKN